MGRLNRVGIIGAGNMGAGIAQKCAQSGLDVILVDVNLEAARRGLSIIQGMLDKGVEKKVFTPGQVQDTMNRLSAGEGLEALKGCDLVVEAVFEDMAVKTGLFSRLGDIVGPETVVGTNTSSFLVTDLAKSYKYPKSFVGLHYFYHPAMNKLLEIIPGEATGREALELSRSFAVKTGKIVIEVADRPGFAVNRFFVPWLNEAARLLGEGAADIPTIDAAAREGFKIGMGPFALMNATGIPISQHSTETLGGKIGPFYGPAPALTRQYEAKTPWDLTGDPDPSRFDAVHARLMGVVCLVCGQILDEKVCGIGEIETGAKTGLRWVKGPFGMMNKLGAAKVMAMVEPLVAAHADLALPASLKEWAASGKPWPVKFVELRVDAPLAFVTFNRPEAMNALNEEVVEELYQAFTAAEAAPGVEAVVLEGRGKAFVAGADIGFFLKQMKAGTPEGVTKFATRGQEIFKLLESSKKWVVAKIEGLALGGGAELALACQTIVASPGAVLGFPETGIGIYPGLGGTQRSLRTLGKPLARWLVMTGQFLKAGEAHELGLVEYLAPLGEADALIRELLGKNPKTKAQGGGKPAGDKWEAIAGLFGDEASLDALLKGQAPEGSGETGAKMAKALSQKAPLALKRTRELLDQGEKQGIIKGLQLELDGLVDIFSTADAMEGLTALIERRKPGYKGA